MLRKIGFFGKKEIFSASMTSSLQGLVVPLITPMNPNGSIDSFSLKTIVARLMNKGVKNFFALNSFSEYEYLSSDQKKVVLETISRELSNKAQLIVGCFGEGSEEVIENVLVAQKYTNLCAVNVPPRALERELEFIDFFDSLFTNTNSNILLYNNSVLFKKNISALWLDNIINWERLVGVIDYSRNPDYLDELGKYYQLTKLFEGNEELAFDALRRGFSGLSCVSSLIFPSYYLSLVNDFSEMNFAKVMRMESKITALNKMIPPSKKIQVIKHVLSIQGLIQPYYSQQLEALTEKEKQIIENAFHLHSAVVENRV